MQWHGRVVAALTGDARNNYAERGGAPATDRTQIVEKAGRKIRPGNGVTEKKIAMSSASPSDDVGVCVCALRRVRACPRGTRHAD